MQGGSRLCAGRNTPCRTGQAQAARQRCSLTVSDDCQLSAAGRWEQRASLRAPRSSRLHVSCRSL
jgi:hypothetical protein